MIFENDYYVISKDFKLVEFNDSVKKRYKGIKVGDYCYKATMKRDTPCLHCPIANNTLYTRPIYFDPFYNDWVQAVFSQCLEDKYSVICYPVDKTMLDIINPEDKEKVKNAVLGKPANEQLNLRIAEQAKLIEGFKGIFFAAYTADLQKLTYNTLFINKEIYHLSIPSAGFIEPALEIMLEQGVSPETKETIRHFNDLSTITERIAHRGLIYQDYIGISNGWCRAHIIPIERDENGRVIKIIYGLSIIQENLTDQLTGCNNRKALSWAYEPMQQTSDSIAVILCDINGLKAMNDTKGHEAGDNYICNAANVFSDAYGKNNVYRIGGDEFIIVIIGGKKDSIAQSVMELKNRCDKENISVSIGYEYRENFTDTFEEILKCADKKMYEAKRDYYRKRGIDRRSSSEIDRMGEYFDSLIDYGSTCYIVACINIAENSFKIIHMLEGYDDSFLKECTTLREFAFYPVKKHIIYSEDVSDFSQWMENTFFDKETNVLKGETETWIRFRSNYNKKSYRLTEIQYFPGRNFSEKNQYGYVFLKDKGKVFEPGRMLFDEVMKDLSENYETIIYINFDTNEVTPYRLSKAVSSTKIGESLKQGDYLTALDLFISNFIAEEDKTDIRHICNRNFFQEQLELKKAFTRDFKTIIEGNEVYYRIKISNMDGPGPLHHCAIGFSNITSELMYKREYQDSGSSILIVESDEPSRKILKSMLCENYKIYEASNGNEAKDILKQNYKEISMVITDSEMPECDGYELLDYMKSTVLYSNIPVMIVASLLDTDNKIKCLEAGAYDFVSKPYNQKIILNRVRGILKLQCLSKTLSSIETDTLTGLYTKEAFYKYVQTAIDNNPDKNYAVLVSDVVGFKAINDQLGRDVADNLLKFLAQSAVHNEGRKFLGGRIGDDVFACLLPEADMSDQDKRDDIISVVKSSPVPNLVMKYGYYCTSDGRDLSVQQMCDRAGIALQSIKGEYGVFFAKYDEKMRNRFLLEQQIIDNMEIALQENQFQVYYQPKHSIDKNDLIGAEALVRWVSPVMGFLSPDKFIPLFETNGFIKKLDHYIWEKVCQEIARWRKRGIEFPISVNVSRKDFSDPNLAQDIFELTNKYDVPTELLHIEVTESAYSDNLEKMKRTVNMLHSNGFIIELDDFGTGYSSLAAINSINIDILKLDMSIIKTDAEKTGRSVLEFSMELAKMMNLKTIQEGVETQEQFNRIKDLGCDYVQGYYFSKPLCNEEFTEYVIKNLKK